MITTKMMNDTLAQIGIANFLAISGGRARVSADMPYTLVLPVSNGYSVEIYLDPTDTYTVRRVFTRGGKRWIKGEIEDVYCDQVGNIAYEASCFRSNDFGAHRVS